MLVTSITLFIIVGAIGAKQEYSARRAVNEALSVKIDPLVLQNPLDRPLFEVFNVYIEVRVAFIRSMTPYDQPEVAKKLFKRTDQLRSQTCDGWESDHVDTLCRIVFDNHVNFWLGHESSHYQRNSKLKRFVLTLQGLATTNIAQANEGLFLKANGKQGNHFYRELNVHFPYLVPSLLRLRKSASKVHYAAFKMFAKARLEATKQTNITAGPSNSSLNSLGTGSLVRKFSEDSTEYKFLSSLLGSIFTNPNNYLLELDLLLAVECYVFRNGEVGSQISDIMVLPGDISKATDGVVVPVVSLNTHLGEIRNCILQSFLVDADPNLEKTADKESQKALAIQLRESCTQLLAARETLTDGEYAAALNVIEKSVKKYQSIENIAEYWPLTFSSSFCPNKSLDTLASIAETNPTTENKRHFFAKAMQRICAEIKQRRLEIRQGSDVSYKLELELSKLNREFEIIFKAYSKLPLSKADLGTFFKENVLYLFALDFMSDKLPTPAQIGASHDLADRGYDFSALGNWLSKTAEKERGLSLVRKLFSDLAVFGKAHPFLMAELSTNAVFSASILFGKEGFLKRFKTQMEAKIVFEAFYGCRGKTRYSEPPVSEEHFHLLALTEVWRCAPDAAAIGKGIQKTLESNNPGLTSLLLNVGKQVFEKRLADKAIEAIGQEHRCIALAAAEIVQGKGFKKAIKKHAVFQVIDLAGEFYTSPGSFMAKLRKSVYLWKASITHSKGIERILRIFTNIGLPVGGVTGGVLGVLGMNIFAASSFLVFMAAGTYLAYRGVSFILDHIFTNWESELACQVKHAENRMTSDQLDKKLRTDTSYSSKVEDISEGIFYNLRNSGVFIRSPEFPLSEKQRKMRGEFEGLKSLVKSQTLESVEGLNSENLEDLLERYAEKGSLEAVRGGLDDNIPEALLDSEMRYVMESVVFEIYEECLVSVLKPKIKDYVIASTVRAYDAGESREKKTKGSLHKTATWNSEDICSLIKNIAQRENKEHMTLAGDPVDSLDGVLKIIYPNTSAVGVA